MQSIAPVITQGSSSVCRGGWSSFKTLVKKSTRRRGNPVILSKKLSDIDKKWYKERALMQV